MRRNLGAVLLAGAACLSAPAFAGEEILYRADPEWAQVPALADLDIASGPALALMDVQQFLRPGMVENHVDTIIRIDTPEVLTQAGTMTAGWMPDKGDLIVHAVEIIRDDGVTDVLKQGGSFSVLRREQGLERRSIDGALTATMSVPGLRVGDAVRLRYTVTTADQALGVEAQAIAFLPAGEDTVGRGSVRLLWPEAAPVRYRAGPDVELPDVKVKNGIASVALALPLAKRDEMPNDAPARYRRPPVLQGGTFADWQEVSAVMAPHFLALQDLAEGGALEAKTDAIMAATSDPLERAGRALRIVQEEISYLANGMAGGNYLPQSPAETWEKRYGDCKAKSLLLHAMLRRMGIESDLVLVNAGFGDAVPELLPVPAAFDHVIVRSRIGGTTYWFDGTLTGARQENLGFVPPYGYGLPLAKAGAQLVEIERRAPAAPDSRVDFLLDYSAGTDLPPLFTVKARYSGLAGVSTRSRIVGQSEEARRKIAQSFAETVSGGGLLSDYALHWDEDRAEARIEVTGHGGERWMFQPGSRNLGVRTETSAFTFNPDRSRPEWRDIPAVVSGPRFGRNTVRIKLPEKGGDFALQGADSVDTTVALTRLKMNAALDGRMLTIEEWVRSPGGEVAASDIAPARRAAARLAAQGLILRAPEDTPRVHDPDIAARIAPLIKAAEATTKLVPESAAGWVHRSWLEQTAGDYPAALASLDKAAAIDASAETLWRRSYVLKVLGKEDRALADMEGAFAAEPQAGYAVALAEMLGQAGRIEEAMEVLEPFEFGDAKLAAQSARADTMARDGRATEGLAVLEDLRAQMPEEAAALNNLCWYRATWQVAQDDMLEVCNRAVAENNHSPASLDSRAFAQYRLGNMEAALADLATVIEQVPTLYSSRYLRGYIWAQQGDARGKAEIALALRQSPELEKQYAEWGLAPR